MIGASVVHPALRAAAERRFAASMAAPTRFFEAHAGAIADACQAMSRRFLAGGRLLVLGEGAEASDAHHVAVEFMHPVIVGKRALPALALTSDVASLTGLGRSAGTDEAFARLVSALGRPHDILMVVSRHAPRAALTRALRTARTSGMLTIALTGLDAAQSAVDFQFLVDETDALVVQEVHETLYHVLWELVHVFFEHRSAPSAAPDELDMLYPFLQPPRTDAADDLLDEVRRSTLAKCADVVALRRQLSGECLDRLVDAAVVAADRFAKGGTLLAFGNGGSATDAQDAAADCLDPPIEGWRPFPALALTNDIGVLTAVANDVGYEHVFARQVIALADARDVALAVSTSGASRNVLTALAEARHRGLFTIGFSGGDGGAMSAACDFCFVAPIHHIPRIQEGHATLWHTWLELVQMQAGH